MTLTTTLDRAPAADPRGRGRSSMLRVAILLAGVILVAVVASMLIGAKLVSPLDLWREGSVGQGILETRMPRTVLGLMAGAALALSGACLQGLTRNPLADPGLLGLNSGATFAMVLAVSVFGIGSLNAYLWFGFAGAAVAAVLVHTVASFGSGGATPAKLVLAGAALAAGVTSWTTAVLLTDKATFDVIRLWQVGTIGGRGWDIVLTGLPFLAVGALLTLVGARTLDTLALGDDLARGLGRRTGIDRAVIGLGVVLLTGTATALCGPIGFVGLIVPHMVRVMVGSAYTRVLPFSAGFGAALTLLADVGGRVVWPPSEIQVGVMTAVVGVPVFVFFLRRGRMAGL